MNPIDLNKFEVKIGQHENDLVSFLQDLVQIPSVNGSDSENAVAERIIVEARKLDLQAEMVSKVDEHQNALVSLGYGVNEFALIGHMDTVSEGNPDDWTSQPFKAAIKEGNMIGRGTADNKGGIACGLYTLFLLRELDLLDIKENKVILAGVVDEESGACSDKGVRFLLDQGRLKSKGAIYTYASDIVCIGHRGLIRIEITTFGESTHAGLAEWHNRERGHNAVTDLAAILLDLEELDIPIEPVQGFEHLGCTITPGTQFSGGNYPSVVPNKAIAMVDIRLLPGQDPEALLKHIDQRIEKVKANRPGLKFEVNIPVNIPGAAIDFNHPLANIGQKYARQLIDLPWEKKGAGPANEGYMLIEAGIPTLCGFGPTGGNAHAPDEWVNINSLIKTVVMYSAIIKEYLEQ